MLNTAEILASFLSHSGTQVHYDHIKASVCNVDFDDVNDLTLDNADGAIIGFLSYMGVSDSNIEDIVGGSEHYSTATLDAIYSQFGEIKEDDLERSVIQFSKDYKEDDATTLDGANPPACRSGYKRKKIIKNGKPAWKCERMFGKAILSAKQKQALRKARLKAHSGMANIRRKKSHKVGTMHGMY